MSSFDWPWQLYRPAGEGGPRPELFDPYDEPLPLEQRSKTTWPGYHEGRTAPNKRETVPHRDPHTHGGRRNPWRIP